MYLIFSIEPYFIESSCHEKLQWHIKIPLNGFGSSHHFHFYTSDNSSPNADPCSAPFVTFNC